MIRPTSSEILEMDKLRYYLHIKVPLYHFATELGQAGQSLPYLALPRYAL